MSYSSSEKQLTTSYQHQSTFMLAGLTTSDRCRTYGKNCQPETYSHWMRIRSKCYIPICIYAHAYTCRIIHNDTRIKDEWRLLYKIYVPLTLFVTFACERESETEQKLQYFDPTPMAVSVVSFLFSWCSTGSPAAQLSAGWWLSLLDLISIFSGPQLSRGPRTPSVWCGFPYHSSSITPSDL